jgi:DNA polymerase-1
VLPAGVVVVELETDSVTERYTSGPDYVRIAGLQEGGGVRVTADIADTLGTLDAARVIVGHNIMAFDLPVLERYGVDPHRLAAEGRLHDTMLTAILLDPPDADIPPSAVPTAYGLDRLGLDKFGVGKRGDLDALAAEHGGYGAIPVTDARYVEYCAGDVALTARLAASQRRTAAQGDYLRREHRVAAIAAQISTNGFLVDVELCRARHAEGQARAAELKQRLADEYGLPLTVAKGKRVTEAKAPLATKGGKIAIRAAFADVGVELDSTRDGSPALGKEARAKLAVRLEREGNAAGLDLLQLVGELLGVRSVYGTALDYLWPDGRVHPEIGLFQASGRWSTTKPGLTVYGKRAGRHVERAIFLPDPGDVVITADLSQVDARAIAAFSQDEAYMDLFTAGQEYDSHELVALAIWGDASRREDAKACGHGFNYGLGFRKLAEKAGDPEVARKFIDGMNAAYPRLTAWKDEIRDEAISSGWLDNGWGRALRITPGREYTQAPALVGQSAARDIMMHGLLRLLDRFPESRHWLRAQVHDEIVLSVPEDRVDEVERVVVECLSFPWRPFDGARGHSRAIEIEAGVGKRGRTWAEVYEK